MVFPKLFVVKQKDISLMTERRDIAGLIKALHSSDFAVQTQAAQALGSLGTAAMNELISRLKNKNKDVRFGVIEALSVIRDPRSIGPLTGALKDENSEVRWQAAMALGEIGDEKATLPLQEALKDPNKYVRYGAAFALATLGWKPNNADERASYFIGMQEWKAVEDIGPDAIPALNHVLNDPDSAVRLKVMKILGSIRDDKAIPALMRGLADSDKDVRWEAALAAPSCGINPMHIPRGLSRRPKTAKNPIIAGVMNFLLPGLGYGYIGKWWGIMIFQIDVTATVWLFKYQGDNTTSAVLFPIYIVLGIHAWYITRKMPDFI
ncbi:HEAT repeat domain-containing protein [Methanoregula sp.]|uniref:HEAT repeat domain-containing protein n=1 Tax=Methanoregula sp. TaxID=2052170 RepID=UPI003BB1081D